MAHELLALGLGLAVAGVGTGLLVPVLRRAQLMDVPNHRSSHVDVTPRGGGIAVLLGVLVVAVAVGGSGGSGGSGVSPTIWTVLGAAVVLALVGLLDDARSLPSRYRLAAQVLAGIVVATVATVAGPTSGIVVAAVCVAGYASYVNAFNFMDGVNGISALSTTAAAAYYWWLASRLDLLGASVVAAGLAGAALGFLPWNLRGRVFLGDVGSYGIGALVAGLAVASWTAGASALLAIAPLVVYLADTGSALVTRAVRGERLGEPHRGHVYQRLVDAGRSHVAVGAWCAGVSGAVGLAVALDAQVWSVVAAGALTAVYLLSPRLLGRRATSPAGRVERQG